MRGFEMPTDLLRFEIVKIIPVTNEDEQIIHL